MRTTLNLDQFFFSFIGKWSLKTCFSVTVMGSCTSENNCSGQWRTESTGRMYDINGLAWLSFWRPTSDPLFAEPMFLFGWTLCNTSTYCMVTFWLSCLNYALRGEAWGISITACHRLLEDIFTYALFWLTRVCVSLKKQLPIVLFRFLITNVCWNQSSYAMNVPLTFIIYFRR